MINLNLYKNVINVYNVRFNCRKNQIIIKRVYIMKKAKSKTGSKNLTIKLNNLEQDLIGQQIRRPRISRNRYAKIRFERFFGKRSEKRIFSDGEANNDQENNHDNENLKFLVYIFIIVKSLAKQQLTSDSYKECYKSAESYFKTIENKR